MRRGIHAHGLLIGVLGSDPLVHLEKVAVALADRVFAQPFDGIGKVQVHAAAARAHAPALVADFFCGPRGDVPRRQVAVGGIFALEEIIPLGSGI